MPGRKPRGESHNSFMQLSLQEERNDVDPHGKKSWKERFLGGLRRGTAVDDDARGVQVSAEFDGEMGLGRKNHGQRGAAEDDFRSETGRNPAHRTSERA